MRARWRGDDDVVHGTVYAYAADLIPVERRTEGLAIFGISGLVAIGLGAQMGEVILAYTTHRGLFLCALVLAALGLMLCVPLRDTPPIDSEPRERARHVLVHDGAAESAASLACGAGLRRRGGVVHVQEDVCHRDGRRQRWRVFRRLRSRRSGALGFRGRLPERLGTRRTLGIAMSRYAAGLGVLSFADTPGRIITAGLLCGAGHGYTFPVLLSLVVARARSAERAERQPRSYSPGLARPSDCGSRGWIRDRAHGLSNRLHRLGAPPRGRDGLLLWSRSLYDPAESGRTVGTL